MANSALTGIVAGAASQAEQEAGSSTTVYVSPGRQQFHPSAAKAWVNFNGTGTVAIRVGYNVTSITDNGVGDYTVNFTSPMSSANYVTLGTVGTPNFAPALQIHTTTTSSVRFTLYADSVGNQDYSIVNIAVFGDM